MDSISTMDLKVDQGVGESRVLLNKLKLNEYLINLSKITYF